MRPPPKKGAAKRPVNAPKASSGYVDDDHSAFQSPEDDDNVTDYGLEFTTSRLTLEDARNRRCSTMRKDTSTARRTRAANRTATSEEDIENRSPVSRSLRTPQNTRTPQTQQRSIAQPQAAAKVNASGAQRRKMGRPVNHRLKMEREIRRLQAHAGLLIPRLPFSRLVREILTQLAGYEAGMRVTQGALEVMQESSELYLTHRLQDSYLLTMHRGRVTLEVRDMALMALLCSHNRLL
ncbi:histone H3-like centromeric protein cid [Drosophila kikkawai]|uniref:Histone H3-like centromeric protein cid n=1 Tax=Drosophila kikkawai TaxID=30033 RepID=A0A6P4IWX4_DROKI|nr:histone H3-like centromeric protein cid [Drosophila kikkawai]